MTLLPSGRRRAPTATPRPPARRGEAGYNLVILMVAVTVMMILVAAALPAWSHAVRRDKEEELIFRGLQYAEAIRVFQQRFGRLPVRLEELIEVEPRCIRQLWPDPFTGERDWVAVRTNVPTDAQQAPPDGREEEEPPDENLPEGEAGLGPVRGVRSRHRGEALKVFFDKDRYEQWLFTVELLLPQAAQGPGGDPGAAPPGVKLRARWLGRPFREGLGAPTMGTGGDGGLPPSDLGSGDGAEGGG